MFNVSWLIVVILVVLIFMYGSIIVLALIN